jgi:hypothetical protein
MIDKNIGPGYRGYKVMQHRSTSEEKYFEPQMAGASATNSERFN